MPSQRPTGPEQAWPDPTGVERVRRLFHGTFGEQPDGVWAAPGRVNVIGEHVDYNAGPCLPIALPHRTFAAVHRRDDDTVRLVSGLAPTELWAGRIADLGPGEGGAAQAGWAAYAAGVAWALRENGYAVSGFDAAIDSCVPLGAGLSSSAALECAIGLALSDLHALGLGGDDAGRTALAAACVRAENDVVGAPTGGMDQAASLRATHGHALLLDNRDQSVRQVPLDLDGAGLALLVIDTRVTHALVDGQYAARRAACESAAARLGLASLREVTDLGAALAALDDDVQRRRVRHVVTEIDRVGRAVALLEAGRPRDLGPLLDASHESLRGDYEVSCPELDRAAGTAHGAGALGARMTGGGFGGSAIALVERADVERVGSAVIEAFVHAGWTTPALFTATPAAGAQRVS